MIKLVAFDLDGTIGNTLPMCIQAFKKATRPYIGHELSDEEVVLTFGLNEEGMIGCVVDEPYRQQALHNFYVIYKNLHQEMCPTPFEGIRELISLLKQKGIIVVLITGKGMNSCDITLKQFNMKTSFTKVITGNAERNIKAEALKGLLHDYHLAANEIVYIGDALSDITECRKANVMCLSAAWSIPQNEVTTLENCNPKNVFYSIPSLSDYLLVSDNRNNFAY